MFFTLPVSKYSRPLPVNLEAPSNMFEVLSSLLVLVNSPNSNSAEPRNLVPLLSFVAKMTGLLGRIWSYKPIWSNVSLSNARPFGIVILQEPSSLSLVTSKTTS